MKTHIFVEVALICVLAALAFPLANEARAVKRALDQERSVTRRVREIVPGAQTGVDALGQLVYDSIDADTRRVVVFCVRDSSLSSDLIFWKDVQTIVSRKNGDVKFVAYCDSMVCARSMREAQSPAPFPVIAYGNPLSAQAALSADQDGAFLLLDRKMNLRRLV